MTISKETEKRIIKLYSVDDKIRMADVARLCGCSRPTVGKIIKSAGVRPHVCYDGSKKAQILELHKKGLRGCEIARIVKCNYSTIYTVFAENGIKNRISRQKVTNEQLKKLIASKDCTVQDIARKLNMCEDQIRHRIEKLNYHYVHLWTQKDIKDGGLIL